MTRGQYLNEVSGRLIDAIEAEVFGSRELVAPLVRAAAHEIERDARRRAWLAIQRSFNEVDSLDGYQDEVGCK